MRKLAAFSISLAAAVFTAHYLLPPGWFIWAAVMFSLLALTGLLFQGDRRRRVLLVCFGAALGFAVSGASFSAKTAPGIAVSGETLTFEAEVTEYPYEAENYTSVAVKLRGGAVPRVGALLYFFRGDEYPALSPGDRITVTAGLKYAGERYGEAWDGHISDNVYLLCYPESVEVTGKSPVSFMYFPREIELAIRNTVSKIMRPSDAAFVTALLTGYKQNLYDDAALYTAMSKAGILHVVAVSGMHVAFLVGFLRLVLRKKKTASAIGIPMVWVFAAVAGGTPSVLRAAFMQSAVLLAPLLKRENDGITSLTAILAVLLVINPDAAASLSLQLSFSAMLGMILVTPKINKSLAVRLKKYRKARIKAGAKEGLPLRAGYKVLYAVIASFAASIGALVFSTPVMVYYFGCVTTYTILVNTLVFWAVSACFVAGYISCFLGMIWLPLGIGGGAVTGVFVSYITVVVKFFGNLPLARIYVGEGYFLFWLIFTYAVFIAWAFLRRGRAFRPVIPSALVLSSLFIGVIILQVSAGKAPPCFTAVDVGQGQSVVLTSGERAAVIDCGGKGTAANAGDTVAAYLLGQGITAVDALCITHFDEDHVNGAVRLMANIPVKCLIIAPENETDTARDEIIAFAGSKGVEVYIINEDTALEIGDIRLTVFKPVSRVKPELVYLASVNDIDILVTGDADETAEKRLLLTRSLPDIEIFVAGHHGSKTSSSMELLEAIGAETGVVSVGYNSYGHPAREVLDRFEALDMEILRTDELGNVNIILSQ